jgi:hypothetical protein
MGYGGLPFSKNDMVVRKHSNQQPYPEWADLRIRDLFLKSGPRLGREVRHDESKPLLPSAVAV